MCAHTLSLDCSSRDLPPAPAVVRATRRAHSSQQQTRSSIRSISTQHSLTGTTESCVIASHSMSILITGAAGFLGQELTLVLLSADATTRLVITDVVEPSLEHIPSSQHARVTPLKLDLTSATGIETVLKEMRLSAAYLLHGIMSSGAEANLAAGYAVNVHSFLTLVTALSTTQPGLITVFTSSLAVYGTASPGEVHTERCLLYTSPSPRDGLLSRMPSSA